MGVEWAILASALMGGFGSFTRCRCYKTYFLHH
jgi:hypothetical protein